MRTILVVLTLSLLATTTIAAAPAASAEEDCTRIYAPFSTAAFVAYDCEGIVAGACTRVVGLYGPCAEYYKDGRVYLRILG